MSHREACCSVGCLGTYVTESYIEKLAFTRACLSHIKVIIVITCVSLVELLYQTTMGWILAFEYMLSGTHELLRPRPIMPGNKCHCFSRPRHRQSLSGTEGPRAGQLDARAHPSRGGRWNGQIGGKILPAHIYHNEEKRLCGLLLGLVLFRFMAPPLQPGVVGPDLVWGVWFPSCFLLEGTDRI
jgi:hypothetical protein